MAITTWAATTGDWDDSEFSRGWAGPAMSPDSAVLSLAPSWASNSNTWAAETEDWEQGLEPSLVFGLNSSPGVANLELLQSYEWDQLTTSWVDTAGNWNSGPVPQVAIGSGISPDKADLTFTAYSPASGIMYDFRIPVGTQTLTGQLPTDGKGFVISPDSGSIEIVQSYTWNNYGGTWAASSDDWDVTPFVPTAVETGQNQPDAGALTLTGYAPVRTRSLGFPIGVGSLTLSSTAPPLGISHFRSPSNASLTGLNLGTTWAADTSTWTTVSGNWDTGTIAPIVGVTYTFSIDAAGNLIFTPYGPQYPITRQPKFIPSILLS